MSAAVTGPLNDGVPLNQLEVMSTYNKKKGRRVRRDDEDVLSEEEKRVEVRENPAERVMLPVFNGPDQEDDENDEDIARRLQEEENAAAALEEQDDIEEPKQ